MRKINWDRIALHSEIEYSTALGGRSFVYKDFIHIYNNTVPWSGDFNRAVGVRVSDIGSFAQIAIQVEKIHKRKMLDRPNRYDIYPPVLNRDTWAYYLSEQGYRLTTSVFFFSGIMEKSNARNFELYSPSPKEYIEWYRSQQQSKSYYSEDWFKKLVPLKLHFIKVFTPYWLLHNRMVKGWVYCAHLGEYSRLFEVEIVEEHRGQGLGKVLLDMIGIEARKKNSTYVLLQTNERLRKFYEKAGFQECTRNSVVWLMEKNQS